MMAREWVVTISKTGARGGAWLYVRHEFDGQEGDLQAFTALPHAKAYGRDQDWDIRYSRVSDNHWTGSIPDFHEDEEIDLR